MSKDLPYFRFYISEWLLGRISDYSDKVQGAFIRAICFYWKNECCYFVEDFKKKLGKKRFDLLYELHFFSIENEMIVIPFLNEQFEQLSDYQSKRVKAGQARAKQMHKQKDSYKDKDNNKDKDKDNNNQSLVLPYDSELFKSTWETVMKSKKWAKKPSTALQASLKKLAKYPEQVAVQMMEETIAGDWQGFFELKQHKQTVTGNKHLDTLSEGAAAIREALGGG